MPYLLDVQNSFLDLIETRVVVPLQIPSSLPASVRNLNPQFSIQGQLVIMNTAALMAIAAFELKRPVDHLAAQQMSIQDAMDTLFGGY